MKIKNLLILAIVLLFLPMSNAIVCDVSTIVFLNTSTNDIRDIEVADLNSDNFPDVVTPVVTDDVFILYNGVGDGTFISVNIGSGNSPEGVAIGDLDSDGDLDIAGVAQLDTALYWFENDGGVYTQHTISTTLTSVLDVAIGDFNGDTFPDIATATYGENHISIFLNNATTNFTEDFQIAITNPNTIEVGLINNDAFLDISVASNPADTVSWLEGDGTGSFTVHAITTTLDSPRSTFIIDLDEDGDNDIVSGHHDDNPPINEKVMQWYENNGLGTFTVRNISEINGSFDIFVSDLDNDNDLDIIGSEVTVDQIIMLENDDSESFSLHNISDGITALPLYVSDVNLDGINDLIYADDENLAYFNIAECEDVIVLADVNSPCNSASECNSGKCLNGFCSLKVASEVCSANAECLSGSCVNTMCTKPSIWQLVDGSKTEQFGDDSNSNNFISLFLMLFIMGVMIFVGRNAIAVFAGIIVFIVLGFFFTIVGWLSPFILLAMILGLLIIFIFFMILRSDAT